MRMWVQLMGPLESGKAKTVQNSARFQTTADFDREYLRNASGYRQAYNGVVNYNVSHVRRRKIGELCSTNYRAYAANVYPPKFNFFRMAIFRPLGVLPPQIFTHAGEWKRLLTHISPTIFNNGNS